MAGAPAATRRSVGARRNSESAQAILDAAQSLLENKGYAGFSIEAVAKQARAGKTTIYRWWPTRAALILDVYERIKRDVVYPDTGLLEDDLFGFIRSLLRVWRGTSAGDVFRSLIAEAQSDQDSARALADYAADRREQVAELVRRAQLRGDADPSQDPVVVADLVVSFAWVHLLTGRLDCSDGEVLEAIRCIAKGVSQQSQRTRTATTTEAHAPKPICRRTRRGSASG